MHWIKGVLMLALLSLLTGFLVEKEDIMVYESQYQLPVLIGKKDNPVLQIKVSVPKNRRETLKVISLDAKGTSRLMDIKAIRVYYYQQDSVVGISMQHKPVFGVTEQVDEPLRIKGNQVLEEGDHYFWVSIELNQEADLQHSIDLQCSALDFQDTQKKPAPDKRGIRQRVGVAVRQHNQDQVHTSRIPGLTRTNKGTLLAIFDARYHSARDLQGDMDIGLHRSEDGGRTWEPMQRVLDMGKWGGLPEKFNGVSDACILVDRNSDAIYIAGLWMHGVLDTTGKWVEGLTEQSGMWNHQWRNKGSQPGFGVKETAQFMIVKSVDDGKTWGKPINITQMGKQKEWWLWAPAPGQGITLKDGTLVFPTQGRDQKGEAFSNISYSKDGGQTWQSSKAAVQESTTECMAVELSDGSIMLNMRANANKEDTSASNGRTIVSTRDLGQTWAVHPTSHKTLQEPVCMASIIRHEGVVKGKKQGVLLFSNPDSKTKRHRMTIKVSLDDGQTWLEKSLLLDEWSSRGYSCLSSIDSETIGILYESSQADMVFQAIKLKDLL